MNDDYKVRPLHLMLLKTSTYVQSYDRPTKWMYFLIENHEFSEKYITIWDKVSTDSKNDFFEKNSLKPR